MKSPLRKRPILKPALAMMPLWVLELARKSHFVPFLGSPSPKPETLQRLKTICDEQERLTKHLLTHNIYLTKHARIKQENTESILISSTSNRASKGTNFKCWINNAK